MRYDAPNTWDNYGLGCLHCAKCGTPTESEPCQAHQPNAYAECNG